MNMVRVASKVKDMLFLSPNALVILFFDRPSPVYAMPMGQPLSVGLFASPAHGLHLKCSTAPAPY